MGSFTMLLAIQWLFTWKTGRFTTDGHVDGQFISISDVILGGSQPEWTSRLGMKPSIKAMGAWPYANGKQTIDR